jgi:hypothetical protein
LLFKALENSKILYSCLKIRYLGWLLHGGGAIRNLSPKAMRNRSYKIGAKVVMIFLDCMLIIGKD